MWIGGRRRGGAKALTDHLLRMDENELVKVSKIEGFAFNEATKGNLEKALKQIEAIGYGKGNGRNLYHAIIAPAYGETLTDAQQQRMIDHYTKQMGFQGYQYALIEHWKNGKQHFHLVFNITDPATGKINELKWTKNKQWRISRELEKMFGLSGPKPKGKSAPAWAMQRGKRTGNDPRKMRKQITAIYHASKTAKEFIAALDQAGYALTHGRRGQLVIVDSAGDTHGLMRMIEGKKLSDLRQKFPGFESMPLPSHVDLVEARKRVTHAKTSHKRSRGNMHRLIASVHQDKRHKVIGRTEKLLQPLNKYRQLHLTNNQLGAVKPLHNHNNTPASFNKPVKDIKHPQAKGYKGQRLPETSTNKPDAASEFTARPVMRELPVRPSMTVFSIIHRPKTEAAKEVAQASVSTARKGWPPAAILDWETWGKRNPARFFALWPELSSGSPKSGF